MANVVITDRHVRNWFPKLRSGDTSLKDKPKPGRSPDLDQDVLKELKEYNLLKSTREVALDISKS